MYVRTYSPWHFGHGRFCPDGKGARRIHFLVALRHAQDGPPARVLRREEMQDVYMHENGGFFFWSVTADLILVGIYDVI